MPLVHSPDFYKELPIASCSRRASGGAQVMSGGQEGRQYAARAQACSISHISACMGLFKGTLEIHRIEADDTIDNLLL